MFGRVLSVFMVGMFCLFVISCTATQLGEEAELMTETPSPDETTLPDLAIQGYRVVYDDCPWGGAGSVSIGVVNGGAAVVEPFQLEVNNSVVEVMGIAAEATSEGVIRFEAGPVGGINAAVDSTDVIAESDESNNEYQILFTPPPPCATATAVP